MPFLDEIIKKANMIIYDVIWKVKDKVKIRAWIIGNKLLRP